MTAIDPVALTQALIRRPSVTPADAGAMSVVEDQLSALGFACRRMRFGEIENLYAR
ncbi:MAG TPA: succinyl-diaminopimelate desuccinylase, partial [Caulobacteraceae bacterium]|nr:succinyl-diaminopimelate desuccinylase [Caulobacteraceae bacterium]